MKLTERDLDIAEAARWPSGEPEAAVRWTFDTSHRGCAGNCDQGRAECKRRPAPAEAATDLGAEPDPETASRFWRGYAVFITTVALAVAAWAFLNH